MRSPLRLLDILCDVYDQEDLKPRDGKTFCNLAVSRALEAFGYDDFKGLMANEIVDRMASGLAWMVVPAAEAQNHANMGCVVVAGAKAEPHGHVCMVRPGQAVISGKWNTTVPKVMNIGIENSIAKSANYVFPGGVIPTFYLWRGSV